MATTVNALTAVEPSADGETVKLVFPRKTGKPLEVILPLEQLALSIPDIQRAAEIRTQKITARASGIESTSFSIVRTIKPRADLTYPRIYLQLDAGTPVEIVYALRATDALQLGIGIMTEAQKWIDSNIPASDAVKQ
jgi:hypothetical protein